MLQLQQDISQSLLQPTHEEQQKKLRTFSKDTSTYLCF